MSRHARILDPVGFTDDAVPAKKRSFTKAELQRLFDYIDDLVDREYAAGSKRWLPLFRDSVAFKVCYAYGLRRREMTMLDLEDFGPNPHVPAYGEFGAVTGRPRRFRRYVPTSADTLFVDRPVNIVEEGIDVAIRIGGLPGIEYAAVAPDRHAL